MPQIFLSWTPLCHEYTLTLLSDSAYMLSKKCTYHDVFLAQGVISEVPEIILRCISRDEAALAVAQKVHSSF